MTCAITDAIYAPTLICQSVFGTFGGIWIEPNNVHFMRRTAPTVSGVQEPCSHAGELALQRAPTDTSRILIVIVSK